MGIKKSTSLIDIAVTNQVTNSNLAEKSRSLNNLKKEDRFTIMIPKDHKQKLKDYFDNSGTNLSNGVRVLIYDFMKDKNII